MGAAWFLVLRMERRSEENCHTVEEPVFWTKCCDDGVVPGQSRCPSRCCRVVLSGLVSSRLIICGSDLFCVGNATLVKMKTSTRLLQTSRLPIDAHKLNSEPPPADDAPEGGGEPLPGGLTDADLESNWDEAVETFDAMELPEELLRGIYSYGFEKPSAIQQRAVKPTMMGRDLIAQAQSGTVRSLLNNRCSNCIL